MTIVDRPLRLQLIARALSIHLFIVLSNIDIWRDDDNTASDIQRFEARIISDI